MSQSMLKKSPENSDGRKDGRTDRRTDIAIALYVRFSNGRIKTVGHLTTVARPLYDDCTVPVR